jgi:FtsP/CotA-like multicopper oxidase with cupredoxin domain
MLSRPAFAIGAGAVASATVVDLRFGRSERARFGSRLPIPPLIDAAAQGNLVKLRAAAGQHEFYKGRPTPTYGYSAPILGPVLHFRRGDRVEIIVENALDVPSTVHWHGLLAGRRGWWTSAEYRAGFNLAANVCHRPARSDALVYPHHDTARQIYLGLAGLIIIEDGNPLGLPSEYGSTTCLSSSRIGPSDRMGPSSMKPMSSTSYTGFAATQ